MVGESLGDMRDSKVKYQLVYSKEINIAMIEKLIHEIIKEPYVEAPCFKFFVIWHGSPTSRIVSWSVGQSQVCCSISCLVNQEENDQRIK